MWIRAVLERINVGPYEVGDGEGGGQVWSGASESQAKR